MNRLFEALLYPEDRQTRGPDPGPFADHRSYKVHLQREFRRKCVYCRISDGIKGYEGFGVDHYLPRSKFPALVVVWSNLFYACNVCNVWKGESVPLPERFLPNPCEHRMADHLQYRDRAIETYTPHGEWLKELLHLDQRSGLRDLVLSALGKFLLARSDLLRDLTAYEAQLENAQSREDSGAMQAAIRETLDELDRVDLQIERLTGEPISGC